MFTWFPIHPIGFTIAGSMPAREAAFSVFWVWLIKRVRRSIGGQRACEKGVPFFVGIIVGDALAVDTLGFCGHEHASHGF